MAGTVGMQCTSKLSARLLLCSSLAAGTRYACNDSAVACAFTVRQTDMQTAAGLMSNVQSDAKPEGMYEGGVSHAVSR